jgi:DNA-binding NarL/FixJ family response regulator
VTSAPPSVRLLHDDAGLWGRATDILCEGPAQAGEGAVVGIVTWTAATREEVAELDALRQSHEGPIVALIADMPSARGARAAASLLEGCVLAEDMERSLRATLVAVSAGQCVAPQAFRRLLDRPPLSPRERQVLAMVVLDFSNAEIAERLVVTESNVKAHLTSAFSKLGVTSRNAAAELILDQESGLGPGILRFSSEDAVGEDVRLPDVGQGFTLARRREHEPASGPGRSRNRA